MSTTEDGRRAEQLVADMLRSQGHEILAMNWRTRRCEIDIVSKKKKTVYFTEVKYRKNSSWGSGFDYITPKKLHQMEFAAQMWATVEKWDGEMVLNASEVDSRNGVEIIEIN